MWNYSLCELMDLGVKIDEYWYSFGNIEYDALDDIRADFLHLFEDDVVSVDGWKKIAYEATKHNTDDPTNER
jgi:hypothetical protein